MASSGLMRAKNIPLFAARTPRDGQAVFARPSLSCTRYLNFGVRVEGKAPKVACEVWCNSLENGSILKTFRTLPETGRTDGRAWAGMACSSSTLT